MTQCRNIYFYGALAEKYGAHFRLHVATATEAIRALAMQIPGFAEDLKSGQYHILIGDPADKFSLDVEEASSFNLGAQDVHFLPAIEGSKSGPGGAAMKVVLGLALVGSALFSAPALSAAGLSATWFGGVTYGNVALLGAALGLSGVSQLLSASNPSEKKSDSYLLDVQKAGGAEGLAIPIVYGDFITNGICISSGLDVERVAEET